uniref:Predicted protein n=1 Tax=Physcomitrium patens TaxID=3218 RepID=A9U6C5_PHYPA
MSREKVKRASEKEEEDRRVRSRSNMDELSLCILTNMEPMQLEICWNATRQKDFRSAQLYPFLRAADNLPLIDVELLEEYLTNYDPEDGSSVVKGRTLGIDENTLHKALQLPIGELAVGTEESSDFNPGSYFKGGMTSLERNQGWRTADALTLELMEWMRFVQKREMAEQRQKLLEQDWVNRATKEANSRLEHALGVKQQAWKKERERLHQGMAHQKQELSNSLNQAKLEVEKMKQKLELN